MSEPVEPSPATAFWRDADETEALRRYRTLLDAVDDGIYQLDADGRFVAVNDALLETTGYDREELLGAHASRLLDDETVETVEAEIERRLSESADGGDAIELALRTAVGDRRRCELRVTLLVEDGTFRGTVGVVREVDGPTQSEPSVGRLTQLERERGLTDRIIEASPVAVVVLDGDGEVTRINERARRLLGVDEGDAAAYEPGHAPTYDEEGRPLPPDEHPFATALETGEAVYDRVIRLGQSDGEDRWLSVNAAPILTDDGEVDRVVTTGEDVTHIKARERELESELSEVYGRVTDAFYALDEDWQFTHANERAEELIDYQGEGLVGKQMWDVFEWGADSKLGDEYRRAMETQEPTSFELYYPDPLDAWYEVHAYPSETGLSVYFQDVTERKRREVALERSEQRYRTLAEHFPNGIVTLFDHDFEYTLAAGRGFEDIPVEPSDLEGRDFREVWDDEVADALEPAFEAALDGEERSVELEYAGREWILRAVPITDERGDVFAGMTMAQDITEQKERERYFRDAKSQLEAATQAGAVGTWEWHIPDDELVGGPSFARTFGVDPDAAREGVPLDEFLSSIHDADRDRVVAEIEDAVDRCGEYEAEYRVRNADDELRWVVARGHVECDEAGDPVTFPGALTDITERKRAEQQLQQHKRQLETLFEVLPVGVIVSDADGRLLEANETAKEIWGGDIFDATSVDDYDQYRAWWAETGERVDPEEWTLARVLDGAEVTDPDVFEIEAEDGTRRVISAAGMPIRDETGAVSRGVVTLTDITERRDYQRRLEESNERLEQFAYAASHDLQEPLRMVSTYLRLIEQRYADALGEDGQEFLEFAVDGADRMREMIDGLLEYSRVDTRGDPLEPVDLDAVFEAVRDDLRMRVEESGAEVTAEPLPRVEGDESQLRQVFQNLLSNAIEYSGDGPPRVHVSAEREGDRWVVSVRDEGIGIDPEHADRVFEVFKRLHTHAEHEGTGIGLALCRRIVERHGGRIWVDSEPGEGSTFRFTLPAEGAR